MDIDGNLIAIYISRVYTCDDDIKFLTGQNEEFQIASMYKAESTTIKRHFHPTQPREISRTSEIIILRKGWMKAQIYDDSLNFLVEIMLEPNDMLFLRAGGHGFECAPDTHFFEIKQGPYNPAKDKRYF